MAIQEIQEIARQQVRAARAVEAALPAAPLAGFFDPLSAEQDAGRRAVEAARHGLWLGAAVRVVDEMAAVFMDGGDAGLLAAINQIASVELPAEPVDITATAQDWHDAIRAVMADWTAGRLRAFVQERAE